jgi:SEC-C motif-containing protein
MDGRACPCGLGDDYHACCGRFHAGAPAPTAESLMRSRYSAFAVGDAKYLLRTWHPSGRPQTLTLDPGLAWTRLAVLETDAGGLFDATGTVRFRAIYVQEGQRGVLAETSRFLRQDGRWTYLGPVD